MAVPQVDSDGARFRTIRVAVVAVGGIEPSVFAQHLALIRESEAIPVEGLNIALSSASVSPFGQRRVHPGSPLRGAI